MPSRLLGAVRAARERGNSFIIRVDVLTSLGARKTTNVRIPQAMVSWILLVLGLN